MKLGKIFKTPQRVTQKFGNKLIVDGKDFYAKFGLKGHDGIDYGTSVYTEVLSPFDGTIEIVKDSKSYGKYVIVTNECPHGETEALFAHLSWARGKTGDKVKAGDIVGTTGGAKGAPGSGDSTGPHLHFGLRFMNNEGSIIDARNGFGGWVDPRPYLQ